jgi:capsular polysaccharide biosynthesis protein
MPPVGTYVQFKHAARLTLDRVDVIARDARLLPSSPYPTARIPPLPLPPGVAFEEVIPAEAPPAGRARTLGPDHPPAFAPLEEHFVARPGLVLSLPGGIVMGPDGAVITPRGELVAETLWSPALFEAGVPVQRRTRRPRRVRLAAASLVAPWHTNWAHWTFNTLPRLRVLEQAGLAGLPVIVPYDLSRAQERSLEAIGIDVGRAIRHGKTPLAFDTLVWPSSATDSHYASSECVRWLRDRVTSRLGVQARPSRRLYVSRPLQRSLPLPPGYPRRAVANEAAVVEMLLRHGFEVVRPETLTFDEQVGTFAGAEIVVAPHGAGSVNALYSRRLALIELFEPTFVDSSIFAIASAAGHDYWFVLGERAGTGDITVPVGLLEETVSAALKALAR